MNGITECHFAGHGKRPARVEPTVNGTYYLMMNEDETKYGKGVNDSKYTSFVFRGKGIGVCEEWRYYPGDKTKQELNRQNYKNYEKWLDEQLKKEGLTYDQFVQLNYSVDRIDNNGNYTPNNCRISSQIEQCNNKDTNRYIYYNGKAIRPMELSRTSDFHWKRVYSDLKDVEYDANALIQKRSQYLFWIEKFINLFYSLSPYVRDNYTFLIDHTDHYNFNYLVHKKYKHMIKSSNEKKITKDSSGREYYIPEKIRYQ